MTQQDKKQGDVTRRARALLNQGASTRQVAGLTGLSQTSVMRLRASTPKGESAASTTSTPEHVAAELATLTKLATTIDATLVACSNPRDVAVLVAERRKIAARVSLLTAPTVIEQSDDETQAIAERVRARLRRLQDAALVATEPEPEPAPEQAAPRKRKVVL